MIVPYFANDYVTEASENTYINGVGYDETGGVIGEVEDEMKLGTRKNAIILMILIR